MTDLILASASPRRADILRMMGMRFRIVPSGVDECLDAPLPPADHVLQISRRKALAVAREERTGLVLGADTVVALGDEILEKPIDAADAHRMLACLSGKTHKVFTGLTLASEGGSRTISEVAATDVSVRCLEEAEIEAYVATGEPLDKAGAYAAQGMAAVFIQSVSGCFLNVVGLPMTLLWSMLAQELGTSPWGLVTEAPRPSGLFTSPDGPVSPGQAP